MYNAVLKESVKDFWDANPCAGVEENYAARLEWLKRTEPKNP